MNNKRRLIFSFFLCVFLFLFALPACYAGENSTPAVSFPHQAYEGTAAINDSGFEPVIASQASEAGAPSDSTDLSEETISLRMTFSEFATELFREQAAEDSLSLHYLLADPSALSIKAPKATLGTYSAKDMRDSVRENRKLQKTLAKFSREKMTEEETFLYDLLTETLTLSELSDGQEYYLSPLSPTTGLQTQLPVLLAEYRFSGSQDVEDYFSLLSSLPALYESLTVFEKERTGHGTGSSPEVIRRIILQCRSFIENPEHNFLIASFQNRLSALPTLSPAEIASYCMKNQKLVISKVIPAYEALIEELEKLPSTASVSDDTSEGICSFPDGKAFYKRLVKKKTGSEKSVEEIENMLQETLHDSLLTMANLLSSEKDGLGSVAQISSASPETQLDFLKSALLNDFPAPAKVDCRLCEVHPSLSDFISPAFYLTPPLDAYESNVIYLNPTKLSSDSVFSTLAHEGYPGHLYQNTYFAATNPHPLRLLLNFSGYDEGYATYAELFSYRYSVLTKEEQQLAVAEQLAGLSLYSLADLRLHYYGDTKKALLGFLSDYGFPTETAEEIYYMLLAEPASYLPYSVGCLEILSLRDEYLAAEGADAPFLPFHKFLLETGPAPFAMLRYPSSQTN